MAHVTSELVALQARADALQAELDEKAQSEATLTERLDAHAKRGVATHELFRLIVESVKDYAIFMLDPRGHVATWNAGAQRIKGYTAEEIIGRHFSTFYPRIDIDAGKCELELGVASSEVGRFEDEGWRVRKDGTQFWANVIISAVRDATGTLIGFSKVTRDLTERKRAEELAAEERHQLATVQAAREVAERASRAKDEFLAMLGHELRNPMAPILTALQLMKLRSDGRATREQEVIERQVKHMMRLVDDLLDVSRISRGMVELQRQRVDIREVLTKALELAGPLLEQRRHHFEATVPDWPITLDADAGRLTQVFANLLTNAAKYTDPGGHITLRVRTTMDQVAIEVRDDGIGIEPDLLSDVFDMFVQGRQGAERSSGGLGLGLSLVRSLVKLHRGSVEVKSDGRGKGSAFTVTLPLAASEPVHVTDDEVTPDAIVAAITKRVLVVDDNDDARELLAEALASVGHDVRAAADPAAALAVVSTFVPEVAILDIGLPVMDGYELAGRLREQLHGRVPRMIALTGYGQPHDRERSREAGFDLHLVKPIDLARLLEIVDELGTDTSRIVEAAPTS